MELGECCCGGAGKGPRYEGVGDLAGTEGQFEDVVCGVAAGFVGGPGAYLAGFVLEEEEEESLDGSYLPRGD